MIESKEEFNELLGRLKAKGKENRLGKTLQAKLQAYLEVEELINLPVFGVSNLFASGKKVQVIDCLHGHGFAISEIVTLKHKEGNQWLAKGFDGNEWYIDEEEANCC